MVLEDQGAACHPRASFLSFCICKFQPKASEPRESAAGGLRWAQRVCNGKLLYFYHLERLQPPVGGVEPKMSQGPVLTRESPKGTHLYYLGVSLASKVESLDQGPEC